MTGKSPDCEVTKIELLNQTGSSEKFLEVHQSLNSNSIGELLSPIPGVMEKSPAGNKVLNNSSIEELISPKTSNLTQSEVDLPPLTSFVFAHKLTKRDLRASLSVRGR